MEELIFLHRHQAVGVIVGSQSFIKLVFSLALSCVCHVGARNRLQCTVPTLHVLLAQCPDACTAGQGETHSIICTTLIQRRGSHTLCSVPSVRTCGAGIVRRRWRVQRHTAMQAIERTAARPRPATPCSQQDKVFRGGGAAARAQRPPARLLVGDAQVGGYRAEAAAALHCSHQVAAPCEAVARRLSSAMYSGQQRGSGHHGSSGSASNPPHMHCADSLLACTRQQARHQACILPSARYARLSHNGRNAVCVRPRTERLQLRARGHTRARRHRPQPHAQRHLRRRDRHKRRGLCADWRRACAVRRGARRQARACGSACAGERRGVVQSRVRGARARRVPPGRASNCRGPRRRC